MPTLTAVLGRTWAIVWRAVVFLVVWGALAAAFLVPVGARLKVWEHLHPLRLRLYADFAGVVSIVAATWLATRFLDRRPLVTIGLAVRPLPRHAALGVVAGTVWIGISLGAAWLGGCLTYRPGQVLSWATLLGAGVALVLNVVTQQLILCGYVFQTIRARAGAPLAMVLAAAMFAGLHAGAFRGAWLPVVNVFLAGFLFCAAFQLTGQLWFPIGMHVGWNFALGPLLGSTVSGSQHLGSGWRVFDLTGPVRLTGGEFGLEGGLIVTVTTCLMLAAVAMALRRGSSAAYRRHGAGSAAEEQRRLEGSQVRRFNDDS